MLEQRFDNKEKDSGENPGNLPDLLACGLTVSSHPNLYALITTLLENPSCY